jgi:hypothetical protein
MKRKNASFALAVVFCVSTAYAQVTGSGTKNTIPVWTGATTVGNSVISQAGGNVGIGTKKPGAKLDVESTSTKQAAIVGSSGSAGVMGFGTGSSGTGVFASGTLDGVFATATGTTGFTYGLNGASVANPSGTGVQGIGASIGVIGTTQSCTTGITCPTAGTAGVFATGSGGNVLVGDLAVNDSWTPVFRVDSTGKGFFDGGTQTGGADFAESVAVAEEFTQREPGDLLIVDATGKRQLKLSTEPYSTLVAGIYSTKPGVLATAHKMGETASNEIPVAIVGIVPCKVSAENGQIKSGDLLVTSSTPGYAMKGTDRTRMLGAVVGKALEPLAEGKGVIQVLVTLQ